MSSENTNYELNTIKGHGLAVGNRFNFHGMASDAWPTPQGTRVELGRVGNKYMLTTVTGEVHTWEFGPSAKVWADTTIKHEVTTAARTMSNGDTAYTAECEHGWTTGFHTSAKDAYAVAEGHGEVSRPLYAPPVIGDAEMPVTADELAHYDSHDRFAPVAEITGAEVEAARVAVRDNGRVFAAEVHNFGGQAAFDILVESGTHTLVNDGGMSRYIRTMRTADGEPITDGMPVWDYNLNPGRVVLSSVDRDGWFYVDTINAGRSLMNGVRVRTMHPYTGQTAREAIEGPSLGAIADNLVKADARHAEALAAEDSAPLDIPTQAEMDAITREHDDAMDAWAAPLLAALSSGPTVAASDRRHAEALAAEVPTRAEDICPVCDFGKVGTVHTTPLGHLCAGNPVPVVEIHTSDGTVITEDDVKARVREAFGPSADQVTEDAWTGAGIVVTASGKTLWAETRNGVTRIKGRRGTYTEWDAAQFGELLDLGVLSRPEVRLSPRVRALMGRRKRKASKVNARRVKGGF